MEKICKVITMLYIPSVEIQDLVVADFRVPSLADDVIKWRDNSNIFMAESCARQIWLGSRETFANFPKGLISENAKTFTLAQGKEAYTLLMQLSLGLFSKVEGETNITGQFQIAWRRFLDTSPHEAKSFEKLVQHVTGDTRLVRHHVLDGWKTRNREICARDLSDMRHGDSVLIIGHIA